MSFQTTKANDFNELKRRAASYGATIERTEPGKYIVCQVDAPDGKVWSASSTYALRVEWERGDRRWMEDAVSDAIQRMAYGLEDVDEDEDERKGITTKSFLNDWKSKLSGLASSVEWFNPDLDVVTAIFSDKQKLRDATTLIRSEGLVVASVEGLLIRFRPKSKPGPSDAWRNRTQAGGGYKSLTSRLDKDWVTTETGTHLYLEGDKVTRGPAGLVGKPINRLNGDKKKPEGGESESKPESDSSSESKPKPADDSKQGQELGKVAEEHGVEPTALWRRVVNTAGRLGYSTAAILAGLAHETVSPASYAGEGEGRDSAVPRLWDALWGQGEWSPSNKKGYIMAIEKALKSRLKGGKKYPDTANGALQCLRDMSDLDLSPGNITRTVPDPSVEGVWGVYFRDGQMAVVYLAGYKDPMGRIRDRDDFETGTPRKSKAYGDDDYIYQVRLIQSGDKWHVCGLNENGSQQPAPWIIRPSREEAIAQLNKVTDGKYEVKSLTRRKSVNDVISAIDAFPKQGSTDQILQQLSLLSVNELRDVGNKVEGPATGSKQAMLSGWRNWLDAVQLGHDQIILNATRRKSSESDSVEHAYAEGYVAGKSGKQPDVCPYKNSDLVEEWQMGREQGYSERRGKSLRTKDSDAQKLARLASEIGMSTASLAQRVAAAAGRFGITSAKIVTDMLGEALFPTHFDRTDSAIPRLWDAIVGQGEWGKRMKSIRRKGMMDGVFNALRAIGVDPKVLFNGPNGQAASNIVRNGFGSGKTSEQIVAEIVASGLVKSPNMKGIRRKGSDPLRDVVYATQSRLHTDINYYGYDTDKGKAEVTVYEQDKVIPMRDAIRAAGYRADINGKVVEVYGKKSLRKGGPGSGPHEGGGSSIGSNGPEVARGSDGYWIVENVNGSPKKVAGPYKTPNEANHSLLEYESPYATMSLKCLFCKGSGNGCGKKGDCPDCGGRGVRKDAFYDAWLNKLDKLIDTGRISDRVLMDLKAQGLTPEQAARKLKSSARGVRKGVVKKDWGQWLEAAAAAFNIAVYAYAGASLTRDVIAFLEARFNRGEDPKEAAEEAADRFGKKSLKTKGSLPMIVRLSQLRERIGDPMYDKWICMASSNLGGPDSNVQQAYRWLLTNAMETDEQGVVEEVNFVRDMVKSVRQKAEGCTPDQLRKINQLANGASSEGYIDFSQLVRIATKVIGERPTPNEMRQIELSIEVKPKSIKSSTRKFYRAETPEAILDVRD